MPGIECLVESSLKFKPNVTTKEELIQEIEQAPEPLLVEVLEFIRSRKEVQVDPVETYLDQILASGDYASDVAPEDLLAHKVGTQDYLAGKDRGITAEQLKAELSGPEA